jgi:D-amino-acid oxidase
VTIANVDAIVVGAGVCGLTTALSLASRGLSVSLVASQLPPDTSSCAAGAMWGPFLVDHPSADGWAEQTLHVLRELAWEPQSGVTMVSGVELARDPMAPHPWLTRFAGAEQIGEAELPPGYRSGWRYTTAVADMPAYSQYLVASLRRAGVRVERAAVRSLRDLASRAPIVVNCSGTGARSLAADPSVSAVRGVVVVVRNPGIDEFYAEVADDDTELTYFIPHGDRVVLGSTLEAPGGRPALVSEVVERIRRRCGAVRPALGRAPVLDVRSGYRPMRPSIRLEKVDDGAQVVIHNYGHGGGGVSVSWGCGSAVATLAEEALREKALSRR